MKKEQIEQKEKVGITDVIKRFLFKVFYKLLNYFGYNIFKINEGMAIVDGNYVKWKTTFKIISKGSCIYIDKNGNIKSKKHLKDDVLLLNVL